MLGRLPRGALICIALLDASALEARADEPPATEKDAGDWRPFKPLLGPDGIDWNTFAALTIAAAEATRQGVKVENCRVQAVEWNDKLGVIFTNADPSHSWQGCPPGPCTCFEVHLTKKNSRVLKAHFSR
jgi:hypothetical protein